MSNLLHKIEEKLGGSSNSEERSRLHKSPPESSGPGNTSNWGTRTTGNDSGAPESVRHPISTTSGPSGSAVDGTQSHVGSHATEQAWAPPTGQHGTGNPPIADTGVTGVSALETAPRSTQGGYATGQTGAFADGHHQIGNEHPPPGSFQNQSSGVSALGTAPGGGNSLTAEEKHEEVTAKELRGAYDTGYKAAVEDMRSQTHGSQFK